MIIRTAADHLFQVRDAGLDHAWLGTEVKRTAAGYQPKAKAREILVRKAATSVVEG